VEKGQDRVVQLSDISAAGRVSQAVPSPAAAAVPEDGMLAG